MEGLKAVGLTVPETTQLLWELRQEGLDVPLDAPQRRGVRAGAGRNCWLEERPPQAPAHTTQQSGRVWEDEQRNE